MKSLFKAFKLARLEVREQNLLQKRRKLTAARHKLKAKAEKARDEHEAVLAQLAARERGQIIAPKSIVAKVTAGKVK